MGTVVVKVSGTAFDENPSRHGSIDDYAKSLASVVGELVVDHYVGLTIGGGTVARQAINRARRLGLDPVRASYLGADAGLMNARIAIAALKGEGLPFYPEPIMQFDAADGALRAGLVPVLYGYWHGLTSDTVAALFASYAAADVVVKLSKVDGVYPTARQAELGQGRFTSIWHDELATMALEHDRRRPGESFVIDIVAAKSLSNSGIPLLIDHWSNLATLRSIWRRMAKPEDDYASGTVVLTRGNC